MIAAAILVIAVAVTVLICMVFYILTGTPERPGRHETPKPPPAPRGIAGPARKDPAVSDQWLKIHGLRHRDDPSDTGPFPAIPKDQDQ